MKLVGSVLWVTNLWDGVHQYKADDSAFAEIGFVPTGALPYMSLPSGLETFDGKVYVALWGLGYNSVAEIVNGAVVRNIPVGIGPIDITIVP